MPSGHEGFQTSGGEGPRGPVCGDAPLEAKRLLFAMAAAGKRQRRSGKWARPKVMCIDVEKARLSGKISEDEFVYASPPEGWGGRRDVLETQLVVVRHEARGKPVGGRLLG